jgi:hypothetical protein
VRKIVQIGLGPLGQKVVRFLLGRPDLKLAVVDPAPDKAGKDAGELCGLKRLGLTAARDLKSAVRGREADVAAEQDNRKSSAGRRHIAHHRRLRADQPRHGVRRAMRSGQ